jgi:preprotein translocase subunit SecE
MNKLLAFLMETKQEFNRINWPTFKETVNLTLIVIFLSIGLAVFLGAVDFGLGYLIQNYLL